MQPDPGQANSDGPARDADVLGYRAAAGLLGIPVGTLYAWVHQRRIPYYRLGPRSVRFSRSAMLTWLEQHAVGAASFAGGRR